MRFATRYITGLFILAVCAAASWAQVQNPDYRVRAKFDLGGESVGNAEFRVISRFMQVYYSGVNRNDEFRFKLSLDSSGSSSPSIDFSGMAFDLFLNDFKVNANPLTADTTGVLDVTYRSDFKPGDEPDLALPSGFPDPVNVGDTVKVFKVTSPSTHELLLSAALEEDILRGDVNADGKVDQTDFKTLKASYDPTDILGPHIGPAAGDFTSDNKSNVDDFNLFVTNWTDSTTPPSFSDLTTPEPASAALLGVGGWLVLLPSRRRRRRPRPTKQTCPSPRLSLLGAWVSEPTF